MYFLVPYRTCRLIAVAIDSSKCFPNASLVYAKVGEKVNCTHENVLLIIPYAYEQIRVGYVVCIVIEFPSVL